jgi:hypothetical protein
MLFVNEIYKSRGTNLWGDLDMFLSKEKSPIVESVRWKYQRKTRTCTKGTLCTNRKGPLTESTLRNPKEVKVMTTFTNCDFALRKMGERGMLQTINDKFGNKVMASSCDVGSVEIEGYTDDGRRRRESVLFCDGQSLQHQVNMLKIPHLAVFDQGEGGSHGMDGYSRLCDVPFEFVKYGKRWILRGCLLGDSAHFTAVARLPNCWLHYDGMGRPSRMKAYPLDVKGSREAMNGRYLAQIYYELVDGEEKRNFGCDNFDYTTVFDFEQLEDKEEKQKKAETRVFYLEELDEDEEENEWTGSNKDEMVYGVGCNDSSSEEEAPTRKAKNLKKGKEKTPQARTRKETGSKKEKQKPRQQPEKRIPPGWTVRPEGVGSRGPLPTCKGCNEKIELHSKCIRRSYKRKRSDNYPTTDQYHCRVRCIEKVKEKDRAALKEFTRRYWTDARVVAVAKEIDDKHRLSM